MLNQNSLSSVMPLVLALQQQNFCIRPVVGTPLAKLVDATRISTQDFQASDSGYQIPLSVITNMANGVGEENGTIHDSVANEVRQVVAQAMRSQISMFRITVAPKVTELMKLVQLDLESGKNSVINSFEVVSVMRNPLLKNADLQGQVEAFADAYYEAVPPYRGFSAEYTQDDVLEFLKTGSRNLDGDIELWIGALGLGKVMEFWNGFFAVAQTQNECFYRKDLKAWFDDPENGEDFIFMAYLLAIKFYENPVTGIEKSLGAHNAAMGKIRFQAGHEIYRKYFQYDRRLNAGQLIIRTEGKQVFVDADVYAKFLNEGGDNEVILGNLVQNTGLITISQLTEKAEALRQAWGSYAAILRTTEKNNFYDLAQRTIASRFTDLLSGLKDEELPVPMDVARKSAAEVLKEFKAADLNDIHDICLRVVCRALYPKTSAEEYLRAMDEIKNDNPSLSPAECASLAGIRWVSVWFASQMNIEPLK